MKEGPGDICKEPGRGDGEEAAGLGSRGSIAGRSRGWKMAEKYS